MAKKIYTIEREGQMDFFDNYGIDYENDNSILVDNTDGVYNGNIFEFKLNISDPNKVLFQAIKYLSKLRIKGESVPATILLIDLNDTKIYKYSSKDYREAIHKVYFGAASKDNSGFVAGTPDEIIDYSNMVGSHKVKTYLTSKKTISELYIPIDINEDCIVGWAERYYREKPKASKGDFLGDDTGVSVKVTGEIRDPKHFKGLITPYTGKTNERFKYLMDCLNDRLSKKDLGAFYTPDLYCKKAAELVLMAVKRALDAGKKDYIILDRCAGTGNLEAALIGLKDQDGEDLIAHCVVSTYEYYEYKVLNERIGSMVRCIIPPTEVDVVYENGKVSNADAMSEDFINNPLIKAYLDDDNCAIILFENPPYRDASAANKTNDNNSKSIKSYVFDEMSKVKDTFQNTNISTVRNLNNQFVWSGFEFYLRQPTDSYVLFSPCNWWKSCGIANYLARKGFLFNREFFHATTSAIMCVLWENIKDEKTQAITLAAIKDMYEMGNVEDIQLVKCYNTFSDYYNKSISGPKDSVFCESSGYETSGRKCDGSSVYNPIIIGYVTPKGFTLDANNNGLVRCTHYNNRGTYITVDNYLQMCPLFVAKEYPRDAFYEKGEGCIYFTTSDGKNKYTKDADFLKSCLIYTCLSNQNKCITFDGSDGRHYQNELCFDSISTTDEDGKAVSKRTVALRGLVTMKLDAEEQVLIDLWNKILAEARATGKCNPDWTYGVYQIDKEINTFHVVGTGKTKKNVYDNPQLNGDLTALRDKLKAYYKSHITAKMFQYELLK